jgi:hypothetical protein
MRTTVRTRRQRRCCVYVRRCARRSYARHGMVRTKKKEKKVIRYVRPSMRTMVVRSEFFFSLKSNSDIQAATGLCLVRLKKEFFATYGRWSCVAIFFSFKSNNDAYYNKQKTIRRWDFVSCEHKAIRRWDFVSCEHKAIRRWDLVACE